MISNWLKQTFELDHSKHSAIRTMEGLRGAAVFFVFLVHYVTLIDPWIVPDSFIHGFCLILRNIGNAGVDLFFVLSGYLIYGTLIKRPQSFFPYIRRRIQRIYPTFITVLILYIAASFLFPNQSKLPSDLWRCLTYLIENILLLPGILTIEPIITVAWSLSYEIFFYLFIPLLITTLNMRQWRSSARLVFFIMSSIIGFIIFWFNSEYIRLIIFVAGIVLYETLFSSPRRPSPFSGFIAILFALTAMMIVYFFELPTWFRFISLYTAFLILCWDCFTASNKVTAFFTFSPLRWYGNMSYSYYLIHGLTLKAMFFLIENYYPPSHNTNSLFFILLLPTFITTLLTSTLLFITIEKPFSLTKR